MPTTSGLIRRFAAGDADAFDAAYRRIAPSLYVWASLRVPAEIRHLLEPEDVLQEVWFIACRRMDDFDPERGTFRSWLFGIANHTLLAQLRKLHRRSKAVPLVTPDRELQSVSDNATSVTRQAARDEQIRGLLEVASSLDPESRLILLYRGLEGWSHKEVARRLEITEGAAEARWRRLRQRLRADLLPAHVLED